ncbi:hypothetical protein NL676_007072 [Syzygium grande]|nr:hypothetical protein NL676_007072 [Syzygium grande]
MGLEDGTVLLHDVEVTDIYGNYLSTEEANGSKLPNSVFLFIHQRLEPYLWENERQSYLRHAVLFRFFVQLNRLYVDTVQKLPSNAESNITRCSTVPQFKYFQSVYLHCLQGGHLKQLLVFL